MNKELLVKVKTLESRHLLQLPCIHDEAYEFKGKEILGRHQGALVVQHANGKLDRVSVTVYVQQQTPIVGFNQAYSEGNHGIPQLFAD